MKKHLLSSIAAAALMATLAMPISAQNIAVVNGKAIPAARADLLKSQVTRAGTAMTPEIEAQIKEELIAREIFLQAAQKKGLEASKEFKDQMELARQTILIRELFVDYQDKNPITDAEAQAEYDKFLAANSGKEYKASHILVEKEDEAKKIIASLKKGGKFEDLAKKSSKDPGSAAKGGDLDWANPRSYVPEFTAALIKLEKGKITETPVKSDFGWHVIKLVDERVAELPKLDEVKPQIIKQLQGEKLKKFQTDLRSAAKVE